ncbi:ABC transporter ATP-binding protein [Rhizobium sp. KVB221]|uniref:ABC transporter ATP-binding protein n=1 Tax=Rhizobium setariae TaxID=2801340 RepID=A0A936YPG2_9HYPH|nr:ABC transporter ATP-binding protein [Rhizobium setariae]MBL0374278.1 ABC transporter ATP-binding protein [Rhizobium setariae]
MTEQHSPYALSFEDVGVAYRVKGVEQQILNGITLNIKNGEAYGIVGESGSGKSTAAFAALRYLPSNGSVTGGRILIDGKDIAAMSERSLRQVRRTSVAMVYQDPSRALNPSIRIGRQIQEIFALSGVPRAEWVARTIDVLNKVRISDPQRVMDRYPHQLSGGMQQRICIAMAIASNPRLLVLDEPTTGLDATVEADVLDLIQQLRQELSTAVLFISHNLGIIGQICDRVGVFYAGRLVEEGAAHELFRAPKHPYTAGILSCLPRAGRTKSTPLETIPGVPPQPGSIKSGCVFASRCSIAAPRCHAEDPQPLQIAGRMTKCHYPESVDAMTIEPPQRLEPSAVSEDIILDIEGVNKTFGGPNLEFRVLRNINLKLRAGETLGIVGESGSGKTTLARSILGLISPDAGSKIALMGQPLSATTKKRTRAQSKQLQIVFQNPDTALNRSQSIRRTIGRTISVLAGLYGAARNKRVEDLAKSVRLDARFLEMLPRQLSGGLKQRVAIARAFASDPQIVVCDEPTSALDASVQAAILNVLVSLQAAHKVGYILISHDLGVVQYLSDRIAVMYLGELVQVGPASEIFDGPQHPYTAALLSAVPDVYGRRNERVKLTGEMPSAATIPSGCVFHSRCLHRISGKCDVEPPKNQMIGDDHVIRCHLPASELLHFRNNESERSFFET